MKIQTNRNFDYEKEHIIKNHPSAKCYNIKFKAEDNSDLFGELFIPKDTCKGIFIEIPDYNVAPKDYLNLSRYTIHNYAVLSIHARGQIGKSNNMQNWSVYAPLLNTDYYTYFYQDVIDFITILEKEIPKKPIYIYGVGQGAAVGLVTSTYKNDVKKLFLSNIDMCDFETIYYTNKDVGFYEPMREYSRNNFNKEAEMFEQLQKIDVLNYAEKVTAKLYYAQSQLNPTTPLECQNRFLELIKDKEVQYYRKFEKENLQECFFDEYILEVLTEL